MRTSSRGLRPWYFRLRDSLWLAIGLSIVLHMAAFGVLSVVVWQDVVSAPRPLIAEAWLGPASAAPQGESVEAPPHVEPMPQQAEMTVKTRVPRAPDEMLDKVLRTVSPKAVALPTFEQSADDNGLSALALPGASGSSGGGAGTLLAAPEAGFFGQRGNAHRVVYVIDTSGSLGWIFEPVQKALLESIEQLRPSQQFHVIFAGATPVELPPGRLVPAIAHYKKPAEAFIRELVPELQCDPIAAMERAFAVKPELIYFLSDGDFGPLGEPLLAKLREWNADHRVHITTIGFGVKLASSASGDQPVGEPILRQIAIENGGHFRWVSPDETGPSR